MTIRQYKSPEQSSTAPEDAPALVLDLCIALLGTLQDDAEVEFARFSEDIVAASKQVASLERNAASQDQEKVSGYINSLLTRMQFSDRFCQRVDNARRSLEGVRQQTNGSPQGHMEEPLTERQATEFLAQTRDIFTTEQERSLFDQMFGASENRDVEDTASDSQNETIFLFDD